jgi:hypothetical protein
MLHLEIFESDDSRNEIARIVWKGKANVWCCTRRVGTRRTYALSKGLFDCHNIIVQFLQVLGTDRSIDSNRMNRTLLDDCVAK